MFSRGHFVRRIAAKHATALALASIMQNTHRHFICAPFFRDQQRPTAHRLVRLHQFGNYEKSRCNFLNCKSDRSVSRFLHAEMLIFKIAQYNANIPSCGDYKLLILINNLEIAPQRRRTFAYVAWHLDFFGVKRKSLALFQILVLSFLLHTIFTIFHFTRGKRSRIIALPSTVFIFIGYLSMLFGSLARASICHSRVSRANRSSTISSRRWTVVQFLR